MVQKTPVEKITLEQIENYLKSLAAKEKSQGTIIIYKRALEAFYNYLPEEKQLEKETLVAWQEELLTHGYAARTVNTKIAAVNGFLEYLQRRDLQMTPLPVLEENGQPELTRKEYLCLLQAAKRLNEERSYLLVKTICCIGVRVQEIPQITLEAVKSGYVSVCSHGVKKKLPIPSSLQKELLDYGKREGITKGLLFITRSGISLSRSHVFEDIKALCKVAKVSEEKANPRCLLKLYQNTQEELEQQIRFLLNQSYENLLNQEEVTIGWKA